MSGDDFYRQVDGIRQPDPTLGKFTPVNPSQTPPESPPPAQEERQLEQRKSRSRSSRPARRHAKKAGPGQHQGQRPDQHQGQRQGQRSDQRSDQHPEPAEQASAPASRGPDHLQSMLEALSTESEAAHLRPRRERVVLASPSRMQSGLHARVELEEQTSWGEHLIKDLMKAQLRMALLFSGGVLLLLAALPLAFYLAPDFARLQLFGIPLPWFLLGVAPFPLFFGVGLWYNLLAERNEGSFVNMFNR